MTTQAFPAHGCPVAEVHERLEEAAARDFAQRSGALTIYSLKGSAAVQAVIADAVTRFLPYNAIFGVIMPSIRQFEQEVVDAWTGLLGGGERARATLTSGGSESLFLALHAAREWARVHRPAATEPEVLVPYSQHAAVSKACHYLGLRLRRLPLDADHRADVTAIAGAIDDNTIAICGSAPSWPYGRYDPIGELAALAQHHGVWMHVDACFGGCLAPFVDPAAHPLPAWDLSVPGVSSLSADLHKYGYAPKPCSLVVFADEQLHAYGPVHVDDWPSGPYHTDGFTGSRPGAAVAGAWAAMTHLGRSGYEEIAARTMEVKRRLTAGIRDVPGLDVWDTELSILVYGSETIDVGKIAGGLFERGWVPLGTVEPPLLHLTVDPVEDAWIDDYLRDLREVCAGLSPESVSADLRYT